MVWLHVGLVIGNDVVRRGHSALSHMLRHQEEVKVGDARDRVVDDSAWVRVDGLAVLSQSTGGTGWFNS